jgi:hypothetical protein
MIPAGSDENTRPMRRVASRSVGRRILILAVLASAFGVKAAPHIAMTRRHMYGPRDGTRVSRNGTGSSRLEGRLSQAHGPAHVLLVSVK